MSDAKDPRCEHCNGAPAVGTKDECEWCEGTGQNILHAIDTTPFEDVEAWRRIIYRLHLTRDEKKNFARQLCELLAATRELDRGLPKRKRARKKSV
jgi:hypothetical protein